MKPDRLIEDLTLVPLPQWWENPWLLLSLPVVIGLLAYSVHRWWMRRQPAPAADDAPSSGPPPHEEFLRRLAELRSSRAQWVAYSFGIEVSDILRGYLEARYAFSVRFQTSREFLHSAVTDPRFNPNHRAALTDFLGQCDALKFAQARASEAELATLVDTAERVIRECSSLTNPGGGAP